MANGVPCPVAVCDFVTRIRVPDDAEHAERVHWLQLQKLDLQLHMQCVHQQVGVPPVCTPGTTAVQMSKSAKKRRRKKGSSYQTKVVDSDKDTASMEVSQSDSVVQIDGVRVCLHEMLKFECRDNLVRIACLRCTERSYEPNIGGSELAIKPDDVSTSVASSDDGQILATQLG